MEKETSRLILDSDDDAGVPQVKRKKERGVKGVKKKFRKKSIEFFSIHSDESLEDL